MLSGKTGCLWLLSISHTLYASSEWWILRFSRFFLRRSQLLYLPLKIDKIIKNRWYRFNTPRISNDFYRFQLKIDFYRFLSVSILIDWLRRGICIRFISNLLRFCFPSPTVETWHSVLSKHRLLLKLKKKMGFLLFSHIQFAHCNHYYLYLFATSPCYSLLDSVIYFLKKYFNLPISQGPFEKKRNNAKKTHREKNWHFFFKFVLICLNLCYSDHPCLFLAFYKLKLCWCFGVRKRLFWGLLQTVIRKKSLNTATLL